MENGKLEQKDIAVMSRRHHQYQVEPQEPASEEIIADQEDRADYELASTVKEIRVQTAVEDKPRQNKHRLESQLS